MHALATRQHRPGRQAQRVQRVAHLEGGGADRGPVQPLVGVEVEDHAVRPLQFVAFGAPDVEFDRAHLHRADQARGIGDIDIVLDPRRRLDGHGLQRLGPALAQVLLEERLPTEAVRQPHQRQRPVGRDRQHPVGDRLVITGEVQLGRAVRRKNHSFGMRDGDAGDGHALAIRDGCGFVHLHLHRGLVLAQAQEGGVAQLAVLGHFAVAHLGQQFRPHPDRAPGVGRAFRQRHRPFQRREAAGDVGLRGGVEAGPDLAAIGPAAALAGRQQQRGKGPAALVAGLPADDHELGPALAFGLKPCG